MSEVEAAFHAGWVVDPTASLRRDDLLEAQELCGFLGEVAASVRALGKRRPLVLLDAAAGRGLVGVLAAHSIFRPGEARLILLERDRRALSTAGDAAARLTPETQIELVHADLAQEGLFPARPDLVTALHACGDATDRVIAHAIQSEARRALIAPCCVAGSLASAERAGRAAERTGIAEHAALRRAHLEAWVLSERTLALEAAGYETEVVSFTSPRVSPHNLVLRARRVGEKVRTERARERLARMHALAA